MSTSGLYSVLKADRAFSDARRGGEQRVRMFLPAGLPGSASIEEAEQQVRASLPPVPCVVVSHGFGSSRLGYSFIGESLASHGVATIHVGHDRNEQRILAMGPAGHADFLAVLENRDSYRARNGDVVAAIDALEAGLLDAGLPCRLDAGRLGFVGHSFGSHTGLLLAGARLAGSQRSFADPRPRAFALLSAPGLGERGLFEGSLTAIDRPVLLSYGTLDTGPKKQPASWRASTFDGLSADGNKLELVIEGAVHETFAGEALEGVPPDPKQLELIESALVAFFAEHLQHGPPAAQVLRSMPGTSLRTK